MGKKGGTNKGKNIVFKVAGARSLKLKNKAKPVGAQLKKLKGDGRELVDKINQEFSNLQGKVRQSGAQKAEAAAKQAQVFAGVRQANAKRKESAAQRQKIKDDIDKLSDMVIS